MLPFSTEIRPGEPVHEQVRKSIFRALILGHLKAGDDFPSVRAISQELRINPNTAHKVQSNLVREGLLEVIPGRGTYVSRELPDVDALGALLLGQKVDDLIRDAQALRMERKALEKLVHNYWKMYDEK